MDDIALQHLYASDGTALAYRQIGPTTAPITIVFSHGFCLTMDAWLPQARHLSVVLGDTARLVLYDHRGHGHSEAPADHATYTLDQLGDDLAVIVDTLSPDSPVVLVGHSMGGMAVLSFAAHHPEMLDRIAGVGLISTAAGRLDACGLGRALGTPAVPLMQYCARHAPGLASQIWSLARNTVAPLLGIPITISPMLHANQACCRMISHTPIATIAALLATFRTHDESAALPTLAHLPALVACGGADRITPMQHSLDLVAALPNAEFLQAPGAGHMLELERPRLVNDGLLRLVTRAQHRHAMTPADDPLRLGDHHALTS